MTGDAKTARPALPGPPIHPIRRVIRYWASRIVVSILVRCYVRPGLVGRERIPNGPAVYCFNHHSWADPFMLMAALPFRPRLYFFGPKEEDMTVGPRNRIMAWSGSSVPYKPGKDDLLDATRRVTAIFRAGGVLAIAGEGRIGLRESDILPLNEGAAYFALRGGVPIVPIALRGTTWLSFGRRVSIVVGEPMEIEGRPTREAIDALTQRTWHALRALVEDAPDIPVPGPVGRRLTELFNDWPEGSREAAAAAAGRPDDGDGSPLAR